MCSEWVYILSRKTKAHFDEQLNFITHRSIFRRVNITMYLVRTAEGFLLFLLL